MVSTSLREAVLKDRLKWLQHQVDLTQRELAKFSKPVPQQLPGVAPAPAAARKKSKWEEWHEEFLTTRAERLVALLGGSGVIADVPRDEEAHPAFINAALAKIGAQLKEGEALADLFDLYFAEAWPADRSPPYGFKTFCSDKVWPKYLAQIRGQEPR